MYIYDMKEVTRVDYKNHEIVVYALENKDTVIPTFGYEILDAEGEVVSEDFSNEMETAMFDVKACLETAKWDVDGLLKENV